MVYVIVSVDIELYFQAYLKTMVAMIFSYEESLCGGNPCLVEGGIVRAQSVRKGDSFSEYR